MHKKEFACCDTCKNPHKSVNQFTFGKCEDCGAEVCKICYRERNNKILCRACNSLANNGDRFAKSFNDKSTPKKLGVKNIPNYVPYESNDNLKVIDRTRIPNKDMGKPIKNSDTNLVGKIYIGNDKDGSPMFKTLNTSNIPDIIPYNKRDDK